MGATTTRLKRFSVLLHSQIGTDGGTPKQKLLLDECTVVRRAEIKPNFEILELGQIDVDSADFGMNRLLSSGSRSTAEKLASKLSHTHTLK